MINLAFLLLDLNTMDLFMSKLSMLRGLSLSIVALKKGLDKVLLLCLCRCVNKICCLLKFVLT